MDYYNDFQNIIRSDDLTTVIDRKCLKEGRDCTNPEIKRAMNDVLGVLDAMKLCHKSAYPWVMKLMRLCSNITPAQYGLFLHIVGGGSFNEYAISEGISEQAAHQMWWRIVRKNPELKEMNKRR